MKNKLILSFLALVVAVIALILLWPLPFSNVIADDAEIDLIITDISIENGMAKQDATQYNFQSESEEAESIRQILSEYSFHRSFRSFLSDTSINGNDAGYWLHLYSDGKGIMSCGGTGEISVNDHVYRIGYWGNKTALEFMNRIRGTLEDKQPVSS